MLYVESASDSFAVFFFSEAYASLNINENKPNPSLSPPTTTASSSLIDETASPATMPTPKSTAHV